MLQVLTSIPKSATRTRYIITATVNKVLTYIPINHYHEQQGLLYMHRVHL
jgi:hypothetical protein